MDKFRQSLITKIALFVLLICSYVFCLTTFDIYIENLFGEFDLKAMIASLLFVIICLLISFFPKYKTNSVYLCLSIFWGLMFALSTLALIKGLFNDCDFLEWVNIIKIFILDVPLFGFSRFLSENYGIVSFVFSALAFVVSCIRIIKFNKTGEEKLEIVFREKLMVKIILLSAFIFSYIFCLSTYPWYRNYEFDMTAIIATILFIAVWLLIFFLPKYKTRTNYILFSVFWGILSVEGLVFVFDKIIMGNAWEDVGYTLFLFFADVPLFGVSRYLNDVSGLVSFIVSVIFFTTGLVLLIKNKQKPRSQPLSQVGGFF